MSDTRAQLAEIDALIAASPDDPSLLTLREDLLQLIALEEQAAPADASQPPHEAVASEDEAPTDNSPVENNTSPTPQSYTAQGTFTEHVSSAAIAEAPDLAPFQPVVSAAAMKAAAARKSDNISNGEAAGTATPSKDDGNNATNNNKDDEDKKEKKKKKKKKGSDENNILEAKFELPTHLVPLDSDTPAQRLKKQRAAKALKSKFREKQKEMEHAKRQNDWKSFATGGGFGGGAGGKKKKKAAVPGMGSSIFATEEGVNAKVGVISGGGGGRKLTNTDQGMNKRHKFH